MDSKKITLRKTKKYGWGVYAKERIRKGTRLASFHGPVYDNNFDKWTKDLLAHTIQFGRTLWRDSRGLARYMNHSCSPNCGIKNLFDVVAMRTIQKGEQITWDYEMTEKSNWWKMRCRCGSLECRGLIGNYNNMPIAVRRRYRGFISAWLLGPKKKLKKRPET